MIDYYLILFIILITFGLFNLVWRVKNDSATYLFPLSHIKIAPRWTILLISAAGLFAGIFFSRDMMDIVRTGIFYPQVFVFSEIMVLFTAMMITDVILVNVFRVVGLPTSNIIMVLFGLLGATVAVSLVRIRSMRVTISELTLFINTDNVFRIIAGLFISVIIAFFIGALVQYLVRFLFTFRYRTLCNTGGIIYGALLISFFTWLVLVRGLDSSYFSDMGEKPGELISWFRKNSWQVLVFGLAFFSFILWGLRKLFHADILNVVLLTGIFMLAFSVSANEMINLSGVPAAGFESFIVWNDKGGISPGVFRMGFLLNSYQLPLYFLVITGLIMVLVILTGKKIQGKNENTLNYGLRNDGEEHTLSIFMARSVVRNAIALNGWLRKITPEFLNRIIRNRFNNPAEMTLSDQQIYTPDKIRLSLNLFLAGILITFAMTLKLPVATAYLAFMVMLGTSLTDRAWGRESAVFRIAGFFNIMGSWLLTAVVAFMVSALLAWIIIVGGIFSDTILITLAVIVIIRSQVILARRRKTTEEEELINEKDEIDKDIESCLKQVIDAIISANKIFSFSLDSFISKNRSQMHQTVQLNNELNKKSVKQRNKIIQSITSMNRMDVNAGYFFIQVFEYQREIAHSLSQLLAPLNEHLENQHKSFSEAQISQLRVLAGEVDAFINFALHIVKEEKLESITEWVTLKTNISHSLADFEKDLLAWMKNKETDVRSSLLLFKALGEIKNLLGHFVSMIKAYRDCVLVNRKST